jgi:tripartite-type tricarboxylate transporter receptor subunit TctC
MAYIRLTLTLLLLGVCCNGANAQGYPSRLVTIVAASAPGGVTDVLARLLAKEFAQDWNQQVIVENKAGANTQLAADFVSHAGADGYTLLVTADPTFVANPILYHHLSYRLKDFTPVTGLVRVNHALIVNPKVPVADLKGLLDLAKASPGSLNYGTWGLGSSAHLSMEYLESLAGVKFLAVHYRGAIPARTAVVAGQVQMMFIDVGNAIEPAKAGEIKILGIGTAKRLPELPDLPTVAESVPGFTAGSWWGIFAPSGTPDDVIAEINAEVRKTFADPQVLHQFVEPQKLQVMTSSPADFADFIKAESVKWGNVIQQANIKVE